MSTDALDSVALAIGSLINAAYLHSPPPLRGGKLNDRPVQALLILLDAAVAVASAIDDNILEGLQALPVDDQNKIKSRLDKIAEKTTQPCAGAAKPKPFPVELAALHDPDFSDGLSSIEHLNRLSGVAPSRPVLLPTEENMSDLADDMLGFTLPEGDGVRLITRALELWGQVAPASAQPAAIAQPAEEPTDDELLRTYGAARRNHQYDGPSDDWPNRAERAATVYGLRAVLTRYGRPAFQPIPVSERLPEPDDCTPWRDDPTAQPWCWAAKDADGWEWIQLSMGHLHSNLGRIMPDQGYTLWAPWWAIPLPGSHLPGATEEAGEEQP
jgi:hypothetical protein